MKEAARAFGTEPWYCPCIICRLREDFQREIYLRLEECLSDSQPFNAMLYRYGLSDLQLTNKVKVFEQLTNRLGYKTMEAH